MWHESVIKTRLLSSFTSEGRQCRGPYPCGPLPPEHALELKDGVRIGDPGGPPVGMRKQPSGCQASHPPTWGKMDRKFGFERPGAILGAEATGLEGWPQPSCPSQQAHKVMVTCYECPRKPDNPERGGCHRLAANPPSFYPDCDSDLGRSKSHASPE